MRKFSIKVSGAKIGDETRPVASRAETIGPRKAPRFGLRVHGGRPELVDLAPALKTTVLPDAAPVTPDDYATADEYE